MATFVSNTKEDILKKVHRTALAAIQFYCMDTQPMQMATCHTCDKMSRQPGTNREYLSTLSKSRGTPWSASKHRTPQSTPKSTFSDHTPSRTPRSVSSNTSSSSSKSSSVKSSPFARLKKLLTLEDKQQSRKGGLKDFLSSL